MVNLNRLGGAFVLVVDDHEDTLEVLDLLLARHGAVVVSTTSARSALDQLVATRFDVILTDLTMPDIDGLELARKTKALRPELPIIGLTAVSLADVTARGANELGFDQVLSKPANPSTLIDAIAGALGR